MENKYSFQFDVTKVRQALMSLPAVAAQESLIPPSLSGLYVPITHLKAIHPDSSVVVGMRGAGKSVWTAVLASDSHREFVRVVADMPVLQNYFVRVGFGLDESGEQFPTAQQLAQYLKTGTDAIDVWTAVVLRHAASIAGLKNNAFKRIQDTVKWVSADPSRANDFLTRCDLELAKKNINLLVVFDAFDRLSERWDTVRNYLLAALRLCLLCRSRKAIRLKLFLRPDMEEDAEVWKFADSSKLRHAKIELSWLPVDLYGLVISHVANSSRCGYLFRRGIETPLNLTWPKQESVYVNPRDLVSNDEALRGVVEAISGRWMGAGAKRGYTFTWIPSHLADAAGRVSPRSFTLAFRQAANWTQQSRPGHQYPLHYDGIQDGVAEASKIRINEIREDYPWVGSLLEAARGLSVPCDESDLANLWDKERLRKISESRARLPPRRFSTDPFRKGRPETLIDDLVELSVLYRTQDGRLNMPDIFRVGFGIKRKGGVRPVRAG